MMRLKYQEAIRQEIEYTFGRRIVSSRDCIDISDDILKKTKQPLNSNTLRRFFGLVKTVYPPSHSTLNILSQYCGFHSAEELYKQKGTPVAAADIPEESRLVYYFFSIFDEITITDNCDKTFLTLVEHTVKFLNSNTGLADKFQRLVAKTQNGQKFYFEQFVNIDKLNTYYANGLRFYVNEKATPEASTFASAIFIYKYWLANNAAMVKEYYKKMTGSISETTSINIYINSRYYAALLFNAQAAATPADDVLAAIYKYYDSIENTVTPDQLFYFEYVIAEAMVLTGNYYESFFYTNQFLERSLHTDCCRHKMSIHQLNLYKAMAAYKTKEVAMAVSIYNTIHPAEFHFNARKYAGILYTYLSIVLKRKSPKHHETFNTLITETGFIRFRKLIGQPRAETSTPAENIA